jgi:hypothetical protein
MKALKTVLIALLLPAFGFLWLSCNKSSTNTQGAYKLSYGDSIIYLKQSTGDYIIYPTEQRAGTYYGFPEGIEIDDVTGAINVSKSETGLRYRVYHVSPQGDTTKTLVVISGINFSDHFYHLSLGDSIAFPVYNADASRILPVSGSNFDDGNTANSGGCSVKTVNGQINLAETVRNGVFGITPINDVRREFDIAYRLNDASGKTLNKLRVRVYYYNTMADVAADLMQTLQDRSDLGVFLKANPGTHTSTIAMNARTGVNLRTTRAAKPRPPCVIIVGQ